MINQQIDIRAIKGIVIASMKYQIKRVTDMSYLVRSQSSPRQYVVANVLGDWNCECPDHSYRHIKCKHMFAVERYIEMNKNKPARKRRQKRATFLFASHASHC